GPANATVKIVRNSAGSPSTDSADVLGSGTLSASTITTNYGWTTVTLSSNPQLNSGTTYWVVIDNTSNSSVDFYTIGANSSYGNGQAKIGRLGSTWADTTPPGLDAFFKVYLGGVTSEIRDIIVGTTVSDRAHAHTANNVDMLGGGTLFCQTGASNNPACDTSLADPSPIAMPISDANIDQWKSDAEAGGVISGDYTPLSSSSSLGPKKIDGDLILPAGHTLIISGTIWVTGNIIAPNNINFQLDSDYELSGGIVMADGYINLSNNVNFFNSGEEGSNIMMLTTSSSDCSLGGACDTYDAVELSNNIGQNANGVIVVAQNGRVDFGNNVSVKAVVANKIHLSNNTTIDYETGLTNQNFVSGPGGTWNIKSWQEVE
ncbi:MAG: choice-of-anchor R domain-containing protein, partial [Patescibacteria group bacterium]